MAVIFRRLSRGALGGAHLVEAFERAEAFETVAGLDDPVDIGAVDVLALGLAVGAVFSADIGAFVPFEAAPFERLENLLLVFAGRTGGIGILDAQDEGTFVLAGEEIVEKGDVGGADMGFAGRGRGDAHPRFGLCHGNRHSVSVWPRLARLFRRGRTRKMKVCRKRAGTGNSARLRPQCHARVKYSGGRRRGGFYLPCARLLISAACNHQGE